MAPDSAAAAIVRRGLVALGGERALLDAGGITIAGRGTFDIGARLQGRRPDAVEPQPLEEQLALSVDTAGIVRLAHETRTGINPDAEEWIRTISMRGERTLLADRLARRTFRIGQGSVESRLRIARVVPHVLLGEALESPERLSSAGPGTLGTYRTQTVAFPLDDGPQLTLHFDEADGLFRGFEYPIAMPVRGTVTIRWAYDAYRQVEGLGPYPGGHTISIGDRVFRRVAYEEVRTGVDAALFALPPDVEPPAPPPPQPASAPAAPAAPPAPPAPGTRELAPGVFLAPNVRGGFHHLLVEFSDFVLVVDATAPWLELHEIPASGERSPEAMDDLGERLIRMIRSRIPSKPIRYVALTHHHDDHAGGVKAFVDSGATVVATDITRQVVDRVAPGAQVQLVRGSMTIADSTMDVQLIDVGDNPHAEGMLIAWLPRQRLLYTSDLWEPQSERFFPSAARVPVMRWFARWIESSGLQPELIYAIHGSARVTPEQLALIRSLPE
jgi:glyoxylase-like metal-dependent hydrolase (beta-lactamase superfamily II)